MLRAGRRAYLFLHFVDRRRLQDGSGNPTLVGLPDPRDCSARLLSPGTSRDQPMISWPGKGLGHTSGSRPVAKARSFRKSCRNPFTPARKAASSSAGKELPTVLSRSSVTSCGSVVGGTRNVRPLKLARLVSFQSRSARPRESHGSPSTSPGTKRNCALRMRFLQARYCV